MAAMTAIGLGLAARAGAQSDAESPQGEQPFATIVVTATRTDTPLQETTIPVTVIDDTDIEQRQAENVTEVLRDAPGVDLVQNGSRGTNTEIFIRGAEADQTLVLIDGVEVNSVTLGAFDFGTLTSDNVERVEILRGGGGTLYGSQAVGGVVNIITRRGDGRPSLSLLGEGGNGSTARGAVSAAGQLGRLHYSLAGAYIGSGGFQPENDDYRNGTASARLDYDVTERATARLFFRYTNSEIGLFNSNNFVPAPDPNARQSDEFVLVKGEWEQELVPDLELRLATSWTHSDQDFRDPPDAAETSLTVSDIPTAILTGEVQVNHYWERLATTTVGLEIENRTADVRSDFIDPSFTSRSRFDESRYNIAGYFQEQLRLLDGGLIAIGGVRVDGNEDFGRAVSPAGSLSYRVPVVTGLRLRAGYAEGFKAPTFNELFFPDFGNPNLDAETSREYDVGVVQSWWNDRVAVEIDGFDRKTDNLIEGAPQDDGSFRAENRGDAHLRGFEIVPSVRLWRAPEVTFAASYARLFRVDTAPLARRPKHRGGFTLNVAGRDLLRPATRYDVNLSVQVVGDRPDIDPAAGFTLDDNPAYGKVDLAGSYTFMGVLAGGDLTLFAKLENLFDEHYQETLGFDAPPVNVLGGVRASF